MGSSKGSFKGPFKGIYTYNPYSGTYNPTYTSHEAPSVSVSPRYLVAQAVCRDGEALQHLRLTRVVGFRGGLNSGMGFRVRVWGVGYFGIAFGA